MEETGWDRDTSPFHKGEQELQKRLGVNDQMERMAKRMMRPYMPEQHQTFFAQLPFIIAGSVDENGWPWASMLTGAPGFVAVPDSKKLVLNGGRFTSDPFWQNSQTETPVGLLGIELPTRRRNRVNGVVSKAGDVVSIDVVQSFGNCPQYIHTRDLKEVRDPQMTIETEVERFDAISENLKRFIEKADTFFVASYNNQDDIRDTGGVDVSHRGGKPGFIKVEGNTFTIPDYIGNSIFNTFGNFLVNPKAGLIFIDFATGDVIQLTGTVDLFWDGNKEIEAFRGAERAWKFHLDHGHILKAASPYRWDLTQMSPNSDMTGDWTETAEILTAQAARKSWRAFRVTKTTEESSVIRSIYLEPENGAALLPFKPGQFLTLRVSPFGRDEKLTRTYTVSSAPFDPHYRISVKREGQVSTYLHDHIKEGSTIEVKAPKGAFWMDMDERRPAVLLAGGVGITPMISMVRQAASDGFSRRFHRPITLIHAAQTTQQRAFVKELSQLQEKSNGALTYVSVISRPSETETIGVQYHASGHVSAELLQKLLPLDDYDFYLCGPPGFMQAMYDNLIKLGVSDGRIFAEAFGPASLIRIKPAAQNSDAPDIDMPTEAVVNFAKSKVEQGWTPDQGSLLEFAEGHGLSPEFGCRNGSCGSCATKLIKGEINYTTKPTFEVGDDEALICCSVPANSDEILELEL